MTETKLNSRPSKCVSYRLEASRPVACHDVWQRASPIKTSSARRHRSRLDDGQLREILRENFTIQELKQLLAEIAARIRKKLH